MIRVGAVRWQGIIGPASIRQASKGRRDEDGSHEYGAVKQPAVAEATNTFEAAWQLLVGRPLRRSQASKEKITPVEGLSALSLDALTSVAYGPEAIIVVLAVAGAGALHLVLPITGVILVLLAILVFSYRQVIDAYPGGGGAYAVSRRQPRGPGEPPRRSFARGRLHPDGRRLDICRRRSIDVCVPELDRGDGPDLPRHTRGRRDLEPARGRQCRKSVPPAHDDLHRRAYLRHRDRAHPPSCASHQTAGHPPPAYSYSAGGRDSPQCSKRFQRVAAHSQASRRSQTAYRSSKSRAW